MFVIVWEWLGFTYASLFDQDANIKSCFALPLNSMVLPNTSLFFWKFIILLGLFLRGCVWLFENKRMYLCILFMFYSFIDKIMIWLQEKWDF